MNATTEAIRPFLGALDRAAVEYVVGGSFASIAWGQPRQTNDIDIVARLDVESGRHVRDDLGDAYMFDLVPLESALESAEEYRSVQIFHLATMFKFDIFIPIGNAFTNSVLQRRVMLELAPGLPAYVCSAEDIVIQKIRWYLLGNRVSDRQWNDIVQVLEIQADNLDRSYMAIWAAEFGLEQPLDDALAEAGVSGR